MSEASILQRFRYMLLAYGAFQRKIGNTAGDPQDTMISSRRKVQALCCQAQKATGIRIQGAVLVEGVALELRVETTLALPLLLDGATDAFSPQRAAIAAGRLFQIFRREHRHLHLQIDTVQQRPRQATAILLDLCRAAATGLQRIAQVAAGTGVHSCDQLEAGGKARALPRTGDVDFPGFVR